MTPADHNKVIGIMHLIYGGFFTLIALLMLLFFGAIFIPLWDEISRDPNAPPAGFFLAIFGFISVLYALMSIPSLLAGYAMLKRKSWARVAGIVASIVAAMSFPFGTALCVYSLWFFFGEKGREFEGGAAAGYGARGSLHQGSPFDWQAQQPGGVRQEERQNVYRPPQQPPDWRG